MKVTYSNSYDRTAGYVAEIKLDGKDISISFYYVKDAVISQGGDVIASGGVIDGGSVSEHWAGRELVLYSTLLGNLDELSANSEWQDRSVWTGSGRFLPDLLLPPTKHTKLWHNVTAETFNSKVRPTNHFMRVQRTSPLDLGAFLLYVPFKDSTFDECNMHILSMIEGIPHLFNGEPIPEGETDPMEAQKAIMPRLTLSGPDTVKADDKAVLDIELVDAAGNLIERDVEVYLEAVSGYLPTKRVQLVKGKGQARVVALGLDAGEAIRVKAGFRFWTGDADHELEVV